MNMVVAGGRTKADFLIANLLEKHHRVVVINDDDEFCKYLAYTHSLPVVCGDPCKKSVMDDAQIGDFDVLIALKPDDADNFEICQMAKKRYHIKKTVCVVSNPKNVEIFKELGINTVISATYEVAYMIAEATTLDSFRKTLELKEDQIILTELEVNESYPICSRQIKELDIPENVIISCIIRENHMIVPNGSTRLQEKDKLLVISSKLRQQEMIRQFSGGNE